MDWDVPTLQDCEVLGRHRGARMTRLTYEPSLERLRERGFLDAREQPPLPSRMPQPTDEAPLGLSFFRTARRRGPSGTEHSANGLLSVAGVPYQLPW